MTPPDVMTETTPAQLPPAGPTFRGATAFAKLFYFVAALGAALGAFVGIVGFLGATGAPQEAAAAALGMLCAVTPYVIARSIDEISR